MESETEPLAENYQTVAKVGEVVEGRGEPFEVNGRMIAVFRIGDEYFAIDDFCPHKGAPLCDGLVFDRSVTCSWHGWRFSLTDGKYAANPRVRIGTYPVRVVGEDIQVLVD